MRGADLDLYEFDFDLTWAAFFMNERDKIYGRFGGRDATSPDKYLTLGGLKHAMREALAAHRVEPKDGPKPEPRKPRTVEQYPAAKRLKANACIHCHQVYDFRREQMQEKETWTRQEIWVYPLPDNFGLTLDPEQGNRVLKVKADSSAAKAGLKEGDLLRELNGHRIASFADAQYALHKPHPQENIPVSYQRKDEFLKGVLTVTPGWRETDISWRGSMWGLSPPASVHGKDLTAAEKKKLGLDEKRLAFRQGGFVPAAARNAGVRQNDIILGIDDKELAMTMLQFNAYVRLNFKVGDRIRFNILREGKRMEIPMTLPKKTTF